MNFLLRDLVSNFGVHAIKNKVNPAALKRYMGYETERSIINFSATCHNLETINSMDCYDTYYADLKGNIENE